MRTTAAWLRSVKRRKPGVYAYRTRRHFNPRRSEWGYVGKSRNLDMRDRCHAGACGRHAGCTEKPWWDLKKRRYVIRLPWWLGWDWLTLSLETLLILALKPRYNIAKNPWPGKLPRAKQLAQRLVRDHSTSSYQAMLVVQPWIDWIVRITAMIIIAAGIGSYLWSR